jgi:hypothetical protein
VARQDFSDILLKSCCHNRLNIEHGMTHLIFIKHFKQKKMCSKVHEKWYKCIYESCLQFQESVCVCVWWAVVYLCWCQWLLLLVCCHHEIMNIKINSYSSVIASFLTLSWHQNLVVEFVQIWNSVIFIYRNNLQVVS